jgi:hypothetical protein
MARSSLKHIPDFSVKFFFQPICFFLFLAWRPSWLEVGITGQQFGRGPPKDYSTKVWLQLAIVIGWFSSKNVSGSSALRPR